MARETLPSPFQFTEGRRLKGPVPPQFEAFYREALRYQFGRRLRTMEVARGYAVWAEVHGAGSLNMPQIVRAMSNIGHRYIHSNGSYYVDVEWADQLPGALDNYPDPDRQTVMRELARIGADLDQLRATVARLPAFVEN